MRPIEREVDMDDSLAIALGVGFAIGGLVLGFLLAAVGMSGR